MTHSDLFCEHSRNDRNSLAQRASEMKFRQPKQKDTKASFCISHIKSLKIDHFPWALNTEIPPRDSHQPLQALSLHTNANGHENSIF